MVKFYRLITEILYQDHKSWILWLVVFYCSGIVIYFALPFEPSLLLLFTINVIFGGVSFLLRRNKLAFPLIVISFLILGIVTASYRATNIAAPKITRDIEFARISGRIVSMTPLSSGVQVVLDRLYIVGFNKSTLPKRVKMTLKSKTMPEMYIGDYIRLKAMLKPPSKPLVPGGYNFARQSYFEQIGATGFNVSDIKVIKKNNNKFANYIENLRADFSKRIKSALGDRKGSIATALIIGEQSAIDKEILREMRVSGLAHILSVSGLHLSMMSLICFFCIRLILSCSTYIAQQYDIKKIAGYVSLVMTLGYLLISGMQIAAVRSYIMVFCVIMAVLLDRQEYALRSVCLAGFLMLLLTPEYVLHPSFQMSFMAVIALVSGYEYYLSKTLSDNVFTVYSRIKNYFFGTLAATFIAGLATAPFAIYYFNQYSNFSLIANLLVAPITSFIIMPAIVLACLTLPFGLEKFALMIIDYGIEFLLYIAKWTSGLSHAVIMLPNMSEYNLTLFVVGMLWLCLWQQKWRVFGILPIIWAIQMLLFTPQPDLVIEVNSHSIMLRSSDGNLVKIENNKRLSPFMTDYLNAKMQTKAIVSIRSSKYQAEFNCDQEWCFVGKGRRLYFRSMQDDVAGEVLVYKSDKQTPLVTANDLRQNGSYFITLKGRSFVIKTVGKTLDSRPWN